MSDNPTLWVRRCLLFDSAFWARLESRARAENVPVAPLLRALAEEALEGRETGRGAVPRTNAEQMLDLIHRVLKQLRGIGVLVGAVGRPMLATQQLLVHWATHEDVLGINPDDLLAELQAAGVEGWQQVLDELREPQDDVES
jgi:hypothetical protein